MIVDASAVLAILFNEPEAELFTDTIAAARRTLIPAPTWLEVALRLETLATSDNPLFDRADSAFASYRSSSVLNIVPFTPDHAEIARLAYRRYGRGTGHPAKLNFGDCMVHAVAKAASLPLLFKGEDFVHTDIEPALKP